MKRVGIVIPSIVTENEEWWRESVRSVHNQTYGRANLRVVHVVRTEDEKDIPRWLYDLGDTVLPFVRPRDDPHTGVAQVCAGYDHLLECGDVDFVTMASANDFIHKDKIVVEVVGLNATRSFVAYCDMVLFFPELDHVGHVTFEDPLSLGKMVGKNCVPDFAMVDVGVLRDVPFVADYGRMSFWVWWINVARHYGGDVFLHVKEDMYFYRRNRENVSLDTRFVDEGNRLMTNWLHTEGLLPKDEQIVSNWIAL